MKMKTNEGMLKLGEYPYTYVRTVTMKSKLYKKDDYHKFLKMELSEITKTLQESDYKTEIDALAQDLSGVELIEHALNNNLVRNFAKLKKISPDEVDELVNSYLRRNDVYNMKTILRGKFANVENSEINRLLIPVGLHKPEFWTNLIEKESVEEVLRALPIKPQKKETALKNFKETNSLFSVENMLDTDYFQFMKEFSQRIPKEGELFRELLEHEIDIINIKNLLRLKKMGEKDIEQYFFAGGKVFGKNRLVSMANSDFTAILETINKSSYRKAFVEHRDAIAKLDIGAIENALDKFLLKKSTLLLHQNPLTVSVILGFMYAKEIEVKNLRMLVKGKQLGLEEDFIEQQLVI